MLLLAKNKETGKIVSIWIGVLRIREGRDSAGNRWLYTGTEEGEFRERYNKKHEIIEIPLDEFQEELLKFIHNKAPGQTHGISAFLDIMKKFAKACGVRFTIPIETN